jgi:hypothetical protein
MARAYSDGRTSRIFEEAALRRTCGTEHEVSQNDSTQQAGQDLLPPGKSPLQALIKPIERYDDSVHHLAMI